MPRPMPRPAPVTTTTRPSTPCIETGIRQCRISAPCPPRSEARTPPLPTAGSRYSRPMSDSSVVLVTGGGSGIGRATAQLAAARGSAVAVLDLHEANARETADAIEAGGGRALALAVDVADDDAVGAAVATSAAEHARARHRRRHRGRHLPRPRPRADRGGRHRRLLPRARGQPRRHLLGDPPLPAPARRRRRRDRHDRVDRGDPRSRVRSRLHGEQGRRRRAHPPRRDAGRAARRARQLHLPRRHRHADDAAARSPRRRPSRGPSDRSRCSATACRSTSPPSRASCSPTTRSTSPARRSRSKAARRSPEAVTCRASP